VELGNATTETTKAARTCRQFYATTFEDCVGEFRWPQFTKTAALALIENTSSEWEYAYRKPNKCLYFRRLLSGDRTDSSIEVPYEIVQDAAGEIILTDLQFAVGEWTTLIEDPNRWGAPFRMAFSLLLAANIAPKVTGGDKFKLGEKAMQKYSLWIAKARNHKRNEVKRQIINQSGFTRARR
jgi:hypothetical protein